MKEEDFRKIRFIKLESNVRYWEDADVNGEEDVDLYEAKEPTKPRMPFAVPNGEKINYTNQDDYKWVITIDTKTGNIVGWPQGTTANVHYKTCDENYITFCDAAKEPIDDAYECYVPGFLSIGDSGYGDYIIFNIEENGHITDFSFTEDDMDEVIRNAF
ncbi:MAG: hypothetical protein MJ237_06205 [bacterium]|nr:hypothetical protein [bacterium]